MVVGYLQVPQNTLLFPQLNIGRYSLFKQEVTVATKAVEEMPKITANIFYGIYVCMVKYLFQDDYNF